jgi:hypothetical protein
MMRWSQGKILCSHNLILQSYTYLSSSICIWSKMLNAVHKHSYIEQGHEDAKVLAY